MKRIVHIDLKGAAPKFDYFKQIFPVLKELGATGLLVEYEDMFPYEGKLSSVPAGNALTKTNLLEIIKLANGLELEIIPLIQTFGHMEFILKLNEFSNLRESADTPQVIAPGLEDTYGLIQTLIDQIITNHPTSRYIHLGCDEVYELGRGRSGEYMKKNNLSRSDMFFEHVSKNVRYLKQKYPQITPIIWDDEFRHESLEMIKKFGLGNVLEPMIWSYQPNPRKKFSDDIWEKYGKAFKNVWAASSFKGSTGSSQYYTNITHHMSNHLAWIDVILEAKKIAPKMTFRGVTLTGWQRYDHFATLCELLPSAFPSLSLCLTTIKRGGFTQTDHEHVQNTLKCSDKELTKCTFPGNDLYALILDFTERENFYKNNIGLQSRLNGWLTDYNIKHGFGSPGQLKVLEKKINQTIANYTSIRPKLEEVILRYYDRYTADEWISVHVDQPLKFLSEKYSEAVKLIKVKIFSKRPLVSKYSQINNQPKLDNTFPNLGIKKNPNSIMPSNFETNRNPKSKQSFEFNPGSLKTGLKEKPIYGRQNELTGNKFNSQNIPKQLNYNIPDSNYRRNRNRIV
ncbi:hypothetical protein LOTGIDRAFT_140764 [Lottia gigantea]|uniref:beta-N-acetylhexosaminidase n=1 Tax=Lottia gigantea TaxID=225164 RepID=V4CEN1_LOTGI|nr:hypothetical protein LOTGIDRAFT_140764 [Lottia gigantea]ESP00420.1 hypothetical protein LOTGIDRAFT_140764 [Lottia gigantea]